MKRKIKNINKIDCDKSPQYNTTMIISQIMISIMKILKSIIFNIILFFLGFGLGYLIVTKEIHYHATHHDLYKYVEELRYHLEKLDQMDEEYTKANKDVKFILNDLARDLAHEHHCNSNSVFGCKTKIGKEIYR